MPSMVTPKTEKPATPQLEIVKSGFVSVAPAPILQMCKDAGIATEQVDSDIFRFRNPKPLPQGKARELYMMEAKFDRPMTSKMAEKIFLGEAYTPATICVLLAYLKHCGSRDSAHPLIALGSSIRRPFGFGGAWVPLRPAEGRWSYGRKLNVGWKGNVWDESCRFLVLA